MHELFDAYVLSLPSSREPVNAYDSAFAGKRQINRDEEKENRAEWSQGNHPAR
jgi:hypothetical protein